MRVRLRSSCRRPSRGVVECRVEHVPPVRYARSRGVSLAYQAVGHGPATIMVIPPLAQNIELAWEAPEYRRVFERIASFSTFVMFDKRGTGASDRSTAMPTMDERVDDTLVVMDEAGIDRAFMLGLSEGGPLALLFAMTYPTRVEGLILHSTFAALNRSDPDHKPSVEVQERHARWIAHRARWIAH